LSISDIEKKSAKKISCIYLVLTAFCFVFSTVYEHFSHGVYSNFMVFLFLFPLMGGVIPFALLSRQDILPYPGRISNQLFHFGIAALTVGSCFQGILEIYGTSSDYIVAYWITGIIFLLTGVAIYLCSLRKH